MGSGRSTILNYQIVHQAYVVIRVTSPSKFLESNNCKADCSTEVCSANYKILRSERDNCAEDTLTLKAETGLHDYEEICEDENCNALKPGMDGEQTECHDDDHEGEGEGDSAAPKTTTVASAAALAALVGGFIL